MEKMLSLKAVISDDLGKPTGYATVYLFDETTQTILPISVDVHSAESLLIAQQNLQLPRPNTHDLLKRVIHSLDAKLIDVYIYDLYDDIFYSYLRVHHKNKVLEIDAKPSDAIAMALRHSVPILAKEEVILRGGIKITENLLG